MCPPIISDRYMSNRMEIIAEGVILHLGDCRDILPGLTGIDAVISDPPYGMNKGFANDSPEVADGLVREVMAWAKDSANGNVLAFWSAQRTDVIEAVFSPKRIMIWNKTFAIYAPNNVGYRYEPIVWVSGKEANSKRGDIFEGFPIAFKAQSENAAHPTQKPLSVMSEIIRDFTNPGDLVLDPFMGSGSTGVAAILFGRRFTGIEIEEKYFDISCRRMDEALKQQDLFVAKPEPAKQLCWDTMWKQPFDKPELIAGNGKLDAND